VIFLRLPFVVVEVALAACYVLSGASVVVVVIVGVILSLML
jgi:hypothetical protein